MTLPDERTRAVLNARDFLRELLDPKKTPRVPLEVRRRARSILKHYPWEMHLSAAAEELSDIWGEIPELSYKYE